MKRNIQPFWDTYGISKHETPKQTNKQTNTHAHTHIYIYTYIYISPQNICIGKTARNIYITRKETYICVIPNNNYVQSQRRNNITRAWLPKEYQKYCYPSLYTAYFGSFWSKFLFLLITFESLFDFVQLKMRAIEPELLKSHGGHRPQPTLLTFLDWPNGPHWCESTCARVPQAT